MNIKPGHKGEIVKAIQEKLNIEELKSGIQSAVDSCNQFRRTEGKKLEEALKGSVIQIANALEKVKKLDPERIQSIKERIQQSIKESRGGRMILQDRIFVDDRQPTKAHVVSFLSLMSIAIFNQRVQEQFYNPE